MKYNVIEIIKEDNEVKLKKIINRKLYKIIELMEFYENIQK